MTKAEVVTLMAEMPDVIDMGKAGKWQKHNFVITSWCNNWIGGENKEPTINMLNHVTMTLLPEYDPAHLSGNGYLPTKNDFLNLKKYCKEIKITDDKGLLFQNGINYLYFSPGSYWTSSCKIVDKVDNIYGAIRQIIAPYSAHINSEITLACKYGYLKVFKARGIERSNTDQA